MVMMLRRLLIGLLFVVLVPASALAHGLQTSVAHTEQVAVGPYRLQLEFDTWPLRQSKNFQMVVHYPAGLEGLKGHLSLKPDPGVKGQTQKLLLGSYPGVSDGWVVQAPGSFGAGRWAWTFEVDGPQGSASQAITLRVEEAPPFPIWLGWLVGLTPLWGLLWFAVRERRRVKTVLAA